MLAFLFFWGIEEVIHQVGAVFPRIRDPSIIESPLGTAADRLHPSHQAGHHFLEVTHFLKIMDRLGTQVGMEHVESSHQEGQLGGGKGKGDRLRPVSYTHLDVYKRQPMTA